MILLTLLISVIFPDYRAMSFSAQSYRHRRAQWPLQNNHFRGERYYNENQQIPSIDFASQELRVQLQSMRRAKVSTRMLSPAKTKELESYLSILGKTTSPVSLQSLCDKNVEKLMGTWWLGFTSENSSLAGLPRDANIYLKIYPNYSCDYCIEFGGTSLQSLTAKSTYSIDSSGLFRFVYKDIVADIFGLKNIPVFFFGLLGGRENIVETVWFDGTLWVERAFSPSGKECFNIYIKDIY